jgi:hypothetical protein
MKKIKSIIIGILVIIGGLFVLGLGIGSVGFVPDNAIVYVDTQSNLYYSPLSLTQEMINDLDLKQSTFGEAKDLGYEMNDECYEYGYFMQEGRSLTGSFLEKIGILSAQMERVDANGNWLY